MKTVIIIASIVTVFAYVCMKTCGRGAKRYVKGAFALGLFTLGFAAAMQISELCGMLTASAALSYAGYRFTCFM